MKESDQNENKRRRRIRTMILGLVLTAIILSISTYAWFIGMRTVHVSSFDVKISSTESLLLSLNGVDWSTSVDISKDTLDTVSYEGHTNWWAGAGLSPVSSVGTIDADASRLIMYEKASLTTTPGGYRLLASRIPNTGETEVNGYVAFDLFVRNFSGTQYITELNQLDEEAIYLSTDSAVAISLDGGVPGTGIENSVRVGFAQIGRVRGTLADSTEETDVAKITGITCNADETNADVTGICEDRPATIWEPNDEAHVVNAISWYNTSCKARTAAEIADASYSGACGTVADEMAYPTYAVSEPIAVLDKVDIYDGEVYNTYTGSTKLTAVPYFTDTDKMKTGVERPTFFTLAANSITKIRVYVWIEGQDIDNYDFASIGKKISVNFGFTKQRFTEEDIDYVAPPALRPEVTLLGEQNMTLSVGDTYDEPGVNVVDAYDGRLDNVTATVSTGDLRLTILGTVDTTTAGTYKIAYRAMNSNGFITTVERTITVE